MKTIKAGCKFILFALLCMVIIPIQGVILFLSRGKPSYVFPVLWHKAVCAIFNIKIQITGRPHTEHQTIYVSNHVSYLDIPVLGSIIIGSFVAKKDVSSWPVFGFLSKLQQTAFISRDRNDATIGKNALNTMLDDGKSLIIFPEGTSTDGRSVYPFKSSLFSIAFKDNLKDLRIQPITLNMLLVDGKTITDSATRDLYSWHIDMTTPLADHLWRFAKCSGAIISLDFHAPIKPCDTPDRKTLAKLCHNTVSNTLMSSLHKEKDLT